MCKNVQVARPSARESGGHSGGKVIAEGVLDDVAAAWESAVGGLLSGAESGEVWELGGAV